MQQIRLGLLHGLAKSQIASFNQPIYNYRQMSEIRNGIEQGLDISKFNNPKLSCIIRNVNNRISPLIFAFAKPTFFSQCFLIWIFFKYRIHSNDRLVPEYETKVQPAQHVYDNTNFNYLKDVEGED